MSGRMIGLDGPTAVPWASFESAPDTGDTGDRWIDPADEEQINIATERLVSAAEAIRSESGEEPYIITLSGESGVGKTTLSQAMSEAYSAMGISCQVLYADGYYQQPAREALTIVRQRTGGRSVGPTEWDLDELQRDLASFRLGGPVPFREIDWKTCDVSKKTMEAASTDILLVDHLMSHLLSADLAIRLSADPHRVDRQAAIRDHLEDRETKGTALLRAVRERERRIVTQIWDAITYPKQLALVDYETVVDESDPETEGRGFKEKLGVLAGLEILGETSRQRVLSKLVALEAAEDGNGSFAELTWIEAGLRLLPSEDVDGLRAKAGSGADDERGFAHELANRL